MATATPESPNGTAVVTSIEKKILEIANVDAANSLKSKISSKIIAKQKPTRLFALPVNFFINYFSELSEVLSGTVIFSS